MDTLVSLGLPKAASAASDATTTEPGRRASRWLPLAFVGLIVPAAFIAVSRSKR